MGISSPQIILDEDESALVLEERWSELGYSESEILVEPDVVGNSYARMCPNGHLSLVDPVWLDRCPVCWYQFGSPKVNL